MVNERRQHRRVARPFEGRFSGSSGNTVCRIADISLGGCFVQSLASPAPGEEVVVTVVVGNHTLVFPGTVVYVDAGMGFAVRFRDIPQEELDELSRLLTALEETGPASA